MDNSLSQTLSLIRECEICSVIILLALILPSFIQKRSLHETGGFIMNVIIKKEQGLLLTKAEEDKVKLLISNLRAKYEDSVITISITENKAKHSLSIDWKAEDARRFERIRRITGYLVGTIDRWNDAKRAEERDRVKHA